MKNNNEEIYTPKQYRYWFIHKKNNYNLILSYSIKDLEEGKYKEDKLKYEKQGYKLINKSEFVGVFYNRELYEGDLVLVVTSSDCGIHRRICPIKKGLQNGKNIGGRGGNAW